MLKIEKFLALLDRKRRERVEVAMSRILAGDLSGLDVKKLRGFESRYRVRIGDIRVVFDGIGSRSSILSIGWRSGSTYKQS